MTALFVLANILLLSQTKAVFTQTGSSIRSVDFYNFTYATGPSSKIVLRKGLWRSEPLPRLFSEERLILLKYADFRGNGREAAVIVIRDLEPGSGPISMDYFVYDFHKGLARQIFHETYEGLNGLCVKGRSLIITTASWTDDSVPIPHCCPEYTERRVYQMRGDTFVVTSRRRWKNYPRQHPRIYKKLASCR
jgi:hypothetical protein